MAGEPWSDVAKAMLAEMWLCGVTSTDASEVLGRSRHAVMGRVNKSGLMGRQASGVVPRDGGRKPAMDAVAAAFEHVMGRPRRQRVEDDVAAVVLAMVADGRRSLRLAAVAGVDAGLARTVEREATRTGLWPRRGSPPARWWVDGADALRADVDRLAAGIRQPVDQAA